MSNDEFPYGACPECGSIDYFEDEIGEDPQGNALYGIFCGECGALLAYEDTDDGEESDPEDLATPPWLADEHETTEDSQARNGNW